MTHVEQVDRWQVNCPSIADLQIMQLWVRSKALRVGFKHGFAFAVLLTLQGSQVPKLLNY